MDRFPEELLYVLLFAALLLVQYLAQLFRRRSRGEAGPQEAPAPPQEKPAVPEEPLPDIWGRAPAPAPAAPPAPPKPAARPEAPADAAVVPRRQRAAAIPPLGRQELRRAIVMMTVLGSCRGQEPPQGGHSVP